MRAAKKAQLARNGESAIAARIDAGVRHQKAQAEIWCWVGEVIGGVSEYPRSLRRGLWAYARGYLEAVKRRDLAFLYQVDGRFYAVAGSADTGFPSWENLPRERWGELPKFGGLFYRAAPHGRFF